MAAATFDAFLAGAKLSSYAAAFAAENVGDGAALTRLSDGELLSLAERCGLKKYHKKRLVAAVNKEKDVAAAPVLEPAEAEEAAAVLEAGADDGGGGSNAPTLAPTTDAAATDADDAEAFATFLADANLTQYAKALAAAGVTTVAGLAARCEGGAEGALCDVAGIKKYHRRRLRAALGGAPASPVALPVASPASRAAATAASTVANATDAADAANATDVADAAAKAAAAAGASPRAAAFDAFLREANLRGYTAAFAAEGVVSLDALLGVAAAGEGAPVEILRDFFRSNALHYTQLRPRVLIPAEGSAVS